MEIATLKPYADYKPSGIEWLGDVPAHWDVGRLKSHTENVVTPTRIRQSNEIYIALEHVESWSGRVIEADSDIEFVSQVNRFQSGDVLFGKLRPYLAKVTRPDRDGVCVGEFLILRPRNGTLQSSYLEKSIRSKPFIDAVTASTYGAKMPRANWEFIGNMESPIPPLAEQTAIVRYIDRADDRILRAISAKERLIELLTEQRQAVIQRVVTRGLDPNVQLKDSGIDWLGDVPSHWEVRRLSESVSDCVNGVWGEEPNGTEDLPCVRVADFDRRRLRVCNPIPTWRAITLNERRRRTLKCGDLLLEKSGGGDLQPVGVVILFDQDEPAVCSNFIAKITVREGYNPNFLTFLHSTLYSIRLNTRSIKQTTGIQNIDSSAYLNEPIVFPPLSEQTSIARYLDKATADIDTAIDKTQRQTDLLREYRTRLIADVVTGQVDVRGAVGDEVELPVS